MQGLSCILESRFYQSRRNRGGAEIAVTSTPIPIALCEWLQINVNASIVYSGEFEISNELEIHYDDSL